jgi:hypothetical protein
VHAICRRYVDLALAGADLSGETSYRRGHSYLTLVADADARKVVFVSKGWRRSSESRGALAGAADRSATKIYQRAADPQQKEVRRDAPFGASPQHLVNPISRIGSTEERGLPAVANLEPMFEFGL